MKLFRLVFRNQNFCLACKKMGQELLHLGSFSGIIRSAPRVHLPLKETAMRMNIQMRALVSFSLILCLLLLPITSLAKQDDRNFKKGKIGRASCRESGCSEDG